MYLRYVITKDNVMTSINAILYYQIMDSVKEMYEIANLPDAIKKETQTTLRYIVEVHDITVTISGKDTRTVYMPYDASAMLSSLGSIKELFKDSENRH